MDALGLTRELLRFDTISPPGTERACALHLAGILERAGFSVAAHEFAEGRRSLVARAGGGGVPLCFTGHIDTVPLGARAWTRDAFAGEVDGGRLYGRGASDMKSGVAAFVAAAVRLAPRLAATPGLVLVITAAEETGTLGAQHLAGVAGALGRAGAVVVAEPTGNYPMVGHKGVLWLHARTTGVTAHGSMPERGVNAVARAARAVLRLESFAFGVAPHPVLGAATLNVGTISGGLNVNSVPDAAVIGLDIRTIPEQKHAALVERLGEHLGHEVALETVMGAEGVWTDPGHPWVQEVYAVTAPVLGTRPEVRAAPYFTDASALTPAYGGAPTVILGPGELALAHQTDEYCEVERLEQAVEVYVELARRWCGL
ncbi:MAG TPA: M20 family metallopeptidase [Methylomirabilota bacterium]|nr:M20 family metallopeptidase [Methylomirabilota bacterium]